MSNEAFGKTNLLFEQAIAGRDFGILAEVYTAEARLLSPGVPAITGLTGIQDYWRSAVSALGVSRAKLHSLEVTVTGDRAAEVGRAEIFTAPDAPPMPLKYVVLWKQEGGSWKWDVDCWNMDG
ncbi:YybH family protein [Belnapia rosea]|uniref:YybH family protein n=1 Tax=Belnapia rosea TaxID=938405 RepID=UPI00088F16BE|nr:nuclear transport factor 2 family protein [Belnapia rosea]SDB73694.1 Ketosteroid isomerase homolog [Belnapia rosea]